MRANRKTLIGRVVSDKMEKTVVVEVESQHPHPLYRRIVRTRKKYKAHDEHKMCHVGDLVKIIESRPLSREKRWRVVQILQRGEVPEVEPREIGVPEGEQV